MATVLHKLREICELFSTHSLLTTSVINAEFVSDIPHNTWQVESIQAINCPVSDNQTCNSRENTQKHKNSPTKLALAWLQNNMY